MGASIGIDLGTTNSVCAYTANGTNPRVLANRERNALTPSVVARHKDGTLLVGSTAVRAARQDPLNVIYSIKRLMGRRFQDKEVAIVQRHVPYRIVAPQNGGSGMAHVMIGEKMYSPIEVSALILEKIKKDAELALGEPVTHAVITVPAHFEDSQREATRQAGSLAGLKVKRIIDEPTAAAYAFGVDMDVADSKAIVVYDLGGGTFDVSVIFIGGGVPTVENIGGDIWLGGDRFDNAIIDFVLRKYPQHEAELRKDPAFMLELKQAGEAAKKELAGGSPSSDITITAALKGKLDVEVSVGAKDFDRMIREDIVRSVSLVEETLAGVNMTSDDINHVLLVGGSTGLPVVQELLATRFGAAKIRGTVNPMECVAMGAAILASRSEKKFCPRKKCSGPENDPEAAVCAACGADLAEVEAQVHCPHCGESHAKHEVVCPSTGKSLVGESGGVTAIPYGIGVEGDRFEVVVQKSTRYPTSEPIFREFKTSSDAQGWIMIPVFQGTDPAAPRNELQGEIVIPGPHEPIPEHKRAPKDTPVDVGFVIDTNGTLTVKVKGKGALSWLDVGEVVRPWEAKPTGDQGDTIRPQQTCPGCGKSTPRGKSSCEHCGESLGGDEKRRPEWQQELLFWSNFAHVAANDFAWCLPESSLRELTEISERADRVVETNDEAAGRLLAKAAKNAVEQHCGGIMDLVEAGWVRRLGLGQLDQNQRLGGMLDDFKRRVLARESPQSPELRNLRTDINKLKSEIFAGLNQAGKVPCSACGAPRKPPTPATPKCEHCGNNPLSLK